MPQPSRSLLPVAVIVVALLAAAGCGGDEENAAPPTSSKRTTTTVPSPASTTSSTVPNATVTYAVYLVQDEALVTAGRTSSTPATPEIALGALLAGPVGTLEDDLGIRTEIPTATTLHAVTVAGDVATVDLSRAFESGGGSLSMQARVAQVVFTVTQFDGIDRVRFRLDGEPVESIGGEGVMVDGVGRADFANVTPAILVESPTVGESVRSPLHVRGVANTFESTVNYTLTDPDGLIIDEGFTTAAGDAGTLSPFTYDVVFTAPRAGMGSLIVYQVSPADGSHTDVREVPIRMQP